MDILCPRAGDLRELVPHVSPLRVLGASHLCGAWALRDWCGWPKWADVPPSVHVSPSRFVATKVGPSETFRNLLELFRYPAEKFPNFSGTLETTFLI